MRKKLKPATFFQDPRLFTHDPRLFTHDPRLFTHDPRLFTHDPRLFTHDPRLLASPVGREVIVLGRKFRLNRFEFFISSDAILNLNRIAMHCGLIQKN